MSSRLLATGLAVMVLASQAFALDYRVGAIKISQPWAKPTLQGAQTGSAYLSLTNSGKTADRLLSGSTPIAGALEIHEMSMTGGIMRMRQITEGLPIAPGGKITLQPGGTHLMLIGLKSPLVAGKKVPATLIFQNAGKVQIDLVVTPASSASASPAMSGMSMPDHSGH
jgi:copper(I)-binding protein